MNQKRQESLCILYSTAERIFYILIADGLLFLSTDAEKKLFVGSDFLCTFVLSNCF